MKIQTVSVLPAVSGLLHAVTAEIYATYAGRTLNVHLCIRAILKKEK